MRARSRTPDTPVKTVTTSRRTSPSASTSRVLEDARLVDDSLDEVAQLRQLVLPRPVPGLLDFGIPPAPEGEPDPALAVCAFPLPILLAASAHILYPAGQTSQLQIPQAVTESALQ